MQILNSDVYKTVSNKIFWFALGISKRVSFLRKKIKKQLLFAAKTKGVGEFLGGTYFTTAAVWASPCFIVTGLYNIPTYLQEMGVDLSIACQINYFVTSHTLFIESQKSFRGCQTSSGDVSMILALSHVMCRYVAFTGKTKLSAGTEVSSAAFVTERRQSPEERHGVLLLSDVFV